MLILFNFPNEIKLSKSNQHHPCNNTHLKQYNTQKSHQSHLHTVYHIENTDGIEDLFQKEIIKISP